LSRPLTEIEQALYLEHCEPHRARRVEAERNRTGYNPVGSDGPWFIAISNTSCERRATQGLEDRGFEVWWPTHQREWKHRISKKMQTVTLPLYPGYLFTRCRTARDWQQMYGVDGLKAVLCNNLQPVTIADSGPKGMAALREHCANWAMPVVEDAFRIGQQVIIDSGPFALFHAVIQKLLDDGAVEVELSLLGRPTRFKLEPDQVRR
jgi:transcription antitermination factor NusG